MEYSNYFINGLFEVRNSPKTIDFNNLKYTFKGPNINPINFIGFKGPLHILKTEIMEIMDIIEINI